MARERNDDGEQRKSDGKERKLSALDRAIMSAIGDGKVVGRDDDPASTEYPEVWEWLTKTEGGKDYIMQPAVLSIQLGPEGVLVSLIHRDLRRMVSVACPHVQDALATLQAALTSPNPPIRPWGRDEAHLKKRRQK